MHGPYTEDVHRLLADTLKAVALAVEAGELDTGAWRLVSILTDAQDELRRLGRDSDREEVEVPRA